MCASHVHLGGVREDLGFVVKVWGWDRFRAACCESESSVLCGLQFIYVCFCSVMVPSCVCVCKYWPDVLFEYFCKVFIWSVCK